MKRILPIIALASVLPIFSACSNDDDDESVDLGQYQKWRDQNDLWVAEMESRKNADGTPYYTKVVPDWNPGIFVLMHYFNDRELTADNLTPLYTSTVDVRYIGYTCEDEPFDSSTTINSYGKLGIARFACNNVVQGWSVALENMHVGDTVEVIVPYQAGYGASISGALLPYSSMRFNIRLDDIYKYEASPY